MYASNGQRSPGKKLLLAILIGIALAIPIFMVWALVYDRQTRSDEARASIRKALESFCRSVILQSPNRATVERL